MKLGGCMNLNVLFIAALLPEVTKSTKLTIGDTLNQSEHEALLGILPKGSRHLDEVEEDVFTRVNRKLGCQTFFQGNISLASFCYKTFKWAPRDSIRKRVNCETKELILGNTDQIVTEKPVTIIADDASLTIYEGIELGFNPESPTTKKAFLNAVRRCKPKEKINPDTSQKPIPLSTSSILKINALIEQYNPKAIEMQAVKDPVEIKLKSQVKIVVTPQNVQSGNRQYFSLKYERPQLRGTFRGDSLPLILSNDKSYYQSNSQLETTIDGVKLKLFYNHQSLATEKPLNKI